MFTQIVYFAPYKGDEYMVKAIVLEDGIVIRKALNTWRKKPTRKMIFKDFNLALWEDFLEEFPMMIEQIGA